MRYGLVLALVLLASITGFMVLKPDQAPAVTLPAEETGVVSVVNEHSPPTMHRDTVKPSAESTTFAQPSDATLHWRDDPERLAAIQKDFLSTFQDKVAETVADAESNKFGDKAIQNAIAGNRLTAPGLQLREEDFLSLTQDQKSELAKVLNDLTYKQKAKDGWISKDFTEAEVAALKETVLAKAIYYPPEYVLDAQGLLQKLDNPAFADQIRALRARIYQQAAPHFADLYNTTRFAIGAIMRNGVDPTTLGDFEGNAALVTPMVREYQLQLEALSREFILGCAEIGSRFD